VFTGIVRELGQVVAIDGDATGVRIRLRAPETAARAAVGDSVALAGVCLTAVAVAGGELAFDAVPETLARTALGGLAPGSTVNVEPALRAGEPLGGHIVQGHVDGVGSVRSSEPEGAGRRLTVAAPPEVLRYCVLKGSIAVDGVSLTLVDVEGDRVSVSLIPHTLGVTTLGSRRRGDRVNIETDILGKYVTSNLPSFPANRR
jgi:riboflavin synthase alpha subunit